MFQEGRCEHSDSISTQRDTEFLNPVKRCDLKEIYCVTICYTNFHDMGFNAIVPSVAITFIGI